MTEINDLERTCESLSKVNKCAKQYARLAEEAYRQQEAQAATEKRRKKENLYTLKQDVLTHLYNLGHYDRVERHNIEGTKYYCLCINGWSFHLPVDDWAGNTPPENEISTGDAIGDYWESTKQQPDISLESAILHICREFEYELGEYVGLCSSTGK